MKNTHLLPSFIFLILCLLDAMAIVTEIMLQEGFDEVSTQLLSLYVMYKYLATKPELTVR